MHKGIVILLLALFLFGAWISIGQVRALHGCYKANTDRYEEISFRRVSQGWDVLRMCEEQVYALDDLTQCLQKVEGQAPSFMAKQMMGMVTEITRLTRGGLPMIADYKKDHNAECDMREYFTVQ